MSKSKSFHNSLNNGTGGCNFSAFSASATVSFHLITKLLASWPTSPSNFLTLFTVLPIFVSFLNEK